jgi:hypothetical protein
MPTGENDFKLGCGKLSDFNASWQPAESGLKLIARRRAVSGRGREMARFDRPIEPMTLGNMREVEDRGHHEEGAKPVAGAAGTRLAKGRTALARSHGVMLSDREVPRV